MRDRYQHAGDAPPPESWGLSLSFIRNELPHAPGYYILDFSDGFRAIGNTGLRVSAIGFGAAPLGDLYGSRDVEERSRAVHCAIDKGINFFDVSPFYGITQAEERLGEALAGKRRR
jgi:hypothetical protein